MDRDTEFEMFKRLCREPKLKAWLEHKLENEVKVLLVADDVKVPQGRAQVFKQMIDLLDAAKAKL